MLAEWLRKAGAEGRQGRSTRYPQVGPCPVRARALDRLYDAAALPGGVVHGRHCSSMVLLGIAGRLLDFHVPGTDAYAGYCMAAAGFLALAHTLKRGEHIRVTLLLRAPARRARGARSSSGRSPSPRCSPRCSPSTACGWPGSRARSTTSRPATTPRRCGSRSSRWRSARVILAIALRRRAGARVARRRRRREAARPRRCAMSDVADHRAADRRAVRPARQRRVDRPRARGRRLDRHGALHRRARPATRWR